MNKLFLSCYLPLVAACMFTCSGCEGTNTPPVLKQDKADQSVEKSSDAEPVNQVAEAGVAKKGKSYGSNPITQPASQYWKIQERLAFMQIENAEKLYKATNGRLPKTHEAYMKEIIEANGKATKLPELPDGLEYRYDPETQKLMVRSIPEESQSDEASAEE